MRSSTHAGGTTSLRASVARIIQAPCAIIWPTARAGWRRIRVFRWPGLTFRVALQQLADGAPAYGSQRVLSACRLERYIGGEVDGFRLHKFTHSSRYALSRNFPGVLGYFARLVRVGTAHPKLGVLVVRPRTQRPQSVDIAQSTPPQGGKRSGHVGRRLAGLVPSLEHTTVRHARIIMSWQCPRGRCAARPRSASTSAGLRSVTSSASCRAISHNAAYEARPVLLAPGSCGLVHPRRPADTPRRRTFGKPSAMRSHRWPGVDANHTSG